jgi:predicted RNA-binding Zn-ribbon protein involved in translation (DUF1610 family)
MTIPEERTGELGKIVRRRKRLVLMTSMPFFAIAAVALLARITSGRFPGVPFSIAGPLAYVTFLATFVAHVLIWRCPACDRYLGIDYASRFCPKCGVSLDGGARDEASSGIRRTKLGFKIWTALLSVFVASALFPSIVGRHGVKKSLLITFLAVCAIWGMYYAVGKLISWAVADELKRRAQKGEGGPNQTPGGEER